MQAFFYVDGFTDETRYGVIDGSNVTQRCVTGCCSELAVDEVAVLCSIALSAVKLI